jgi:hypothetical protein
LAPSARTLGGGFSLRFSNTQGIADIEFGYGNPDMLPVAGDFGTLPGGDDPPPTSASGLDVVQRDEWGAVAADVTQLTTHTIRALTVHHAGDQSATTGPSRYRSWQSHHMSRGWVTLRIISSSVSMEPCTKVATRALKAPRVRTMTRTAIFLSQSKATSRPMYRPSVSWIPWCPCWRGQQPNSKCHRQRSPGIATTLQPPAPGGHLYPYIASGQLEAGVSDALLDGRVTSTWRPITGM